jgi:ATP-binding cassette subfamily B (MDR/TAP) protein 1
MTAVLSIGRLAGPIVAIAKAATAATELFVTIDAEVPDMTGLKDPDVSTDSDIRFENVAFSYPSRPNVQILDGLDITFQSGKVTAIVGPSGSGKSTVVALLQRWYDLLGTTAKPTIIHEIGEKITHGVKEEEKEPKIKKSGKTDEGVEKEPEPHTCTGAVLIGHTEVRQVDWKWWRSQIGLVQQECVT